MSAVERAAEVIADLSDAWGIPLTCSQIAQALAAAGLLATDDEVLSRKLAAEAQAEYDANPEIAETIFRQMAAHKAVLDAADELADAVAAYPPFPLVTDDHRVRFCAAYEAVCAAVRARREVQP